MRRRVIVVRQGALVAMVALLVALTAPAASARPSCPTLGVAELQSRIDASGGAMSGHLKTVVKGSAIVDIPVTVLAVTAGFQGGPADMASLILFRATGPEIDRIGGIASGMSGSPVYVNDAGVDKLVGALSYGDAFTLGGTGLATPIEAMVRIGTIPATSGASYPLTHPVLVDGVRKDTVMIAPGTKAPASESTGTIVAKPLGAVFIGGLDPKSRMYKAYSKVLEAKGLNVMTLTGGLASGPAPYEARFEGGSAVAVLAARGDLWVGGIGTVTYTDGDKVFAFGHPAFWDGESGLYLCNAWIDGIWPSSISPYKLGRPAAVRGMLTQDRAAGVMGIDGRIPEDVSIRAKATNLATGEVARSETRIPRFVADSSSGGYDGLAAVGAYVAGSRVFDSFTIAGSAATTTTVRVSDETTTYTLTRRNLYSEGVDVSMAVVSDVDEIVSGFQALNGNGIAHARVMSVDLETTFSATRREAEISDVTVAGVLKAGENTVTVSFAEYGSTSTRHLDVPLYIPAGVPLTGSLSAGSIRIPVIGGGSPDQTFPGSGSPPPGASVDRRTVAEFVGELNEEAENTAVSVMFRPGMTTVGGESPPGTSRSLDVIKTTVQTGWVVRGTVTKSAAQLDVFMEAGRTVGFGQSAVFVGTLPDAVGRGTVTVVGAGSGVDTFAISDGSFVYITPPLYQNTTLVVTFLGNASALPAETTFEVAVSAKTRLSASKRTLAHGKQVRLTARVLPQMTGGRVVFQRKDGSRWKTIKSIALSPSGTAVCKYTPSRPGSIRVRARFSGSASNAPSTSDSVTLRVR